MTEDLIKKFVKERNEALKTLDRDKVNEVMDRWGSPPLPEGEVAIVAMHKARSAITSEDMAPFARASIRWLHENGYTDLR